MTLKAPFVYHFLLWRTQGPENNVGLCCTLHPQWPQASWTTWMVLFVNQTRVNVGSNWTGQPRGKQFVVLSSSLFSLHSFHGLSPFFPLTVDRPSVRCLVRDEKPQWFRTKWNVQSVCSAVVALIIYFYGCYWFTLWEEMKWICIWSVYPALMEMMTSLGASQGTFSSSPNPCIQWSCSPAVETQQFMYNILKFITT